MIIGFTGTQQGMTTEQRVVFVRLCADIAPGLCFEFHHGDCVGADAEAHAIVRAVINDWIYIHPSSNDSKRAWCEQGDYPRRSQPKVTVLPAKDYLARNRDIVNAVDVLIACPKEMEEVQRSGTWATVRYARKVKKRVIIIYPNGGVQK